MPELYKTSLRCHQKLPYLLSPLAEAVHWGAWGLRVHQSRRPHHCSPRHCASSHSPAALGETYWLGCDYCCDVPGVCGARRVSPFCSHCLQKCCAHHLRIQSQILYLFLESWNWKDLFCCSSLQKTRNQGCWEVTEKQRDEICAIAPIYTKKCIPYNFHWIHWPWNRWLGSCNKRDIVESKAIQPKDNFFSNQEMNQLEEIIFLGSSGGCVFVCSIIYCYSCQSHVSILFRYFTFLYRACYFKKIARACVVT